MTPYQDNSGPCVVCGKYLRAGTGRWQEGHSLYARLDGKTVRVGAACDTHFDGERNGQRWMKADPAKGDWIDPTKVHLIRPKPEPTRTTGDHPYHGGST